MNENVTALQKERDLSDELASTNLTADAYSRWNACRSSMRFMSFVQKELIVYRLLFGQPQILDTLRCASVGMEADGGLVSRWDTNKGIITVQYTPVEVHDGCFLFHIRNSNVEYDQYKGKFNAKFSMRYRTRINPQNRVDGAVYMLEKAVFTSTFGA